MPRAIRTVFGFTFHYGKIKTDHPQRSDNFLIHLHSIMVRLKHCRCIVAVAKNAHLHSIMVRLKLSRLTALNTSCIDLHSIMVRLKRIIFMRGVNVMTLFTFHYGKIKTGVIKGTLAIVEFDLHSIMVRLKQVLYKPRYFPKLSHPKLSTS